MTLIFLAGTDGIVVLFTKSTGRDHFNENHDFGLRYVEVGDFVFVSRYSVEA